MCCFAAVTPDNFHFWCVERGEDILRVMKRSKNRPKRQEIQNIVGSDGVTYPSVISQPISNNGFTWDSSDDDMERAEIYLSNFAYGMQVGLITFSNL